MVRSARSNGFNTILVQVRGRGDAYFTGGIEPRAAELSDQPASFDPLAETLAAARQAGLRVHAWISVGLVSSAVDLPASRDHVVNRHPEWLMVPRSIAEELAIVDPRSPSYIGRIARAARAESQEVEGLYLSPIQTAAATHTVAVVTDLVSRYAVDGIHLDYVRYPRADFDYSASTLAEFRANVLPDLSPDDRRNLDERAAVDRFVYVDMFPERWGRFRRSRLTSLVMRLRTAVKSARPEAMLSAAVVADPDEAFARRLQDWRTWADNGFVDVICPMAYTSDAALFAEQIAAVRKATDVPLWAGIGAYMLSPAQTVEHIVTARRLGSNGVVLFSYDSLTDPSQSRADYLTEVGRRAFGSGARSTFGFR
jgi:uncharacterized lipoprotein YddW (UPF0748 family)